MTRTVVIVPLDRSPYPRAFLDDLNGYMTGGSGRCLEAILAAGAHVTTMPPASAPEGMREAIVAIINEEVDGDYDGRLHYVGAAADAILAIIAKGEGRE